MVASAQLPTLGVLTAALVEVHVAWSKRMAGVGGILPDVSPCLLFPVGLAQPERWCWSTSGHPTALPSATWGRYPGAGLPYSRRSIARTGNEPVASTGVDRAG
ncbi:hypothetical protein MPNT_330003 [Candidatus Methylacidithermus pantelleriae]|uniref:Uncharacterized protein n=1 Tax=Candidatus Methylacidithermus pantelleriae TaxID=2744239 RepID=A0A8J2BMS4_9BACT|nr:hypothetical protein MPNT_330003 [Candidatus Methylacidithermus pantelleriae]